MALSQRVFRASRHVASIGRSHLTQFARCQASMSTGAAQERLVRVAHILLNANDTATLESIQQSLQGGEEFAELAKKHSTCSSASRGGEIGWLSAGQYYPDFERAAFSTAPGEVAQALTQKGLHLLKVLETRTQAVIQHMDVSELAEALANPILLADDGVQLVDVREPSERDIAALPGFQLFPLSQVGVWAPKVDQLLDKERETIVLCHHGVRSMQMASLLVSKGFQNVKNVTGGIHAYSQGVDPSVPTY